MQQFVVTWDEHPPSHPLSFSLSVTLHLPLSLPLYSTGIWGILFFASLQIFHSSEKVKKIAQLIT